MTFRGNPHDNISECSSILKSQRTGSNLDEFSGDELRSPTLPSTFAAARWGATARRDPNRQITFIDDPLATAQVRWLGEGADWLHMVNLDGAFAQANDNGALEQIARLGAPVQFGGGLRSLEDIIRA
jgi:hypothetical protein